jgi:hypothetical protein
MPRIDLRPLRSFSSVASAGAGTSCTKSDVLPLEPLRVKNGMPEGVRRGDSREVRVGPGEGTAAAVAAAVLELEMLAVRGRSISTEGASEVRPVREGVGARSWVDKDLRLAAREDSAGEEG